MNVFEILFFETSLDKKAQIGQLISTTPLLYNYFCLLQELYSLTKHAGVVICEINDPSIFEHFIFHDGAKKYIGLVIMDKDSKRKIQYFYSPKYSSWFHYFGPGDPREPLELPEHKQICALQNNQMVKFSNYFKTVPSKQIPVFLMAKEIFRDTEELEERMERFCADIRRSSTFKKLKITDIITPSMHKYYKNHTQLFTCRILKFILGLDYQKINAVMDTYEDSKYLIFSQFINVDQCEKYGARTRAFDYCKQIEYLPTEIQTELRKLFHQLTSIRPQSIVGIGCKYETIDNQTAQIKVNTDDLQRQIESIDQRVTDGLANFISGAKQKIAELEVVINKGRDEFETYVKSRVYQEATIADIVSNTTLTDPRTQNNVLLSDFLYYNTAVPDIRMSVPIEHGVDEPLPTEFKYEFYTIFGHRWLLAIDQDTYLQDKDNQQAEDLLHFQQTVMPPILWFNNQKKYTAQSNFIKSFAGYIYSFFKIDMDVIARWSKIYYFNFKENMFAYFMWLKEDELVINEILDKITTHNAEREKLLKYETKLDDAISAAKKLMHHTYFKEFKEFMTDSLSNRLNIANYDFSKVVNFLEFTRKVFTQSTIEKDYTTKMEATFNNFGGELVSSERTKILLIIKNILSYLLSLRVNITDVSMLQDAYYNNHHNIRPDLIVKNMPHLLNTIFKLQNET